MRGWRLVFSAIVLSLVQIGFLGWIIAGRAAILRSGTEVLLKVEPVDPRDLLRGDYVSLRYDITNIPTAIIANIPEGTSATETGPIFVRLRQEPDGFWRAVSASFDVPASAPPEPGEADIRGEVVSGRPLETDGSVQARYGIERFYLPEGAGRAIETDMRVRPFAMRVAISRDGAAQIRALIDEGRTLFEEPLY
ncbi:MAG TPA: GDYXXLXY domain-containing protein [Rhizobiaceae bacterium]|nr:GDYXXLXY domain-containing protein [Rhizobiaceae bacterium]